MQPVGQTDSVQQDMNYQPPAPKPVYEFFKRILIFFDIYL